jgi:hypothetical protein
MFRRLIALAMGIALMLIGPSVSAAAAKPTTETRHEHKVVETFVDLLPECGGEGPLYSITTTANLVEHVTEFPDGRLHVHFAQTGRFVAEPLQGGGASYSGTFTITATFSQNKKSSNGTSTFSIRGTGSDGSTLRVHFVDHSNERPDGSVNQFFSCH